MSTNGVHKAANQYIESDANCVTGAKCDQIHTKKNKKFRVRLDIQYNQLGERASLHLELWNLN